MTSVVSGLAVLALLLACSPASAGQVVRSTSAGHETVTIVDHGSARGRPAIRTSTRRQRAPQPAEPAQAIVAQSPRSAPVDFMAAQTASMLALRLSASPETNFPDIGIDPTAYDLRLLGAVPNETIRAAVAAQAFEITGAPALHNELQPLSDWEPSAYLVFDDTHVAERVRLALLSWPELHAADIDVAVEQGITTLTGSVATADERTLASTAAASAAGVYLVQNRLSLLRH
jgi:osmotically-inducible protein OsmY